MSDDLLARLLDKVEHRFYGKYRGLVRDNSDPENRGRLRLSIPAVLGPDVVSGWALPCAPYGGHDGRGFFFIPEVGDGVWVEFEAGLIDYPVWVGTFWAKPGGATEVPPPANTQQPPTSKVIKTSKHTIELADADGSEAITIIDETNNNKVTLDSNGVTIEGDAIKIGAAAADKLIKGDTLKALLTTWFNTLATHIHPNGNMGAPTGQSLQLQLSPPPDLASALSQKHSVE